MLRRYVWYCCWSLPVDFADQVVDLVFDQHARVLDGRSRHELVDSFAAQLVLRLVLEGLTHVGFDARGEGRHVREFVGIHGVRELVVRLRKLLFLDLVDGDREGGRLALEALDAEIVRDRRS